MNLAEKEAVFRLVQLNVRVEFIAMRTHIVANFILENATTLETLNVSTFRIVLVVLANTVASGIVCQLGMSNVRMEALAVLTITAPILRGQLDAFQLMHLYAQMGFIALKVCY